MIGVILTAGQGQRLRPYTNDRPKGLVEINGIPLLDFSIALLEKIGAHNITVIGGFEGEKVKKFVEAKQKPHLSYTHVNEYQKGNLISWMAALPHITNEDVFLMNADHLYKRAVVEKIVGQKNGITAFCDTDRILGDDDMKVNSHNNVVTDISKKLENFTHGYVGCTHISKELLPLYQATAQQLQKENDGTFAVEKILAHVARTASVNIGDISGAGWFEIDTPEELKIAELFITNNTQDFYL